MILISQDGETIVRFENVALSIDEDGAIYQVVAYMAGDFMSCLVMGEYYSKEDALKQLELVVDAYQFANRFQFAEA